MRKRRVLALLLALSLVVSGNGMTAFAAEQGTDMPVSVSQEEGMETTPEGDQIKTPTTDTPADDQTGTPDAGGEDSKQGETSEEKQDPAETEKPETPETPGETEPEAPKGDDAGQGENKEPAEEGGEEKPVEEPAPAPETPVEEPAPVPEEPAEGTEAGAEEPAEEMPAEKNIEVQPYTSRMVTFTDDIGMKVTYDANASEQYVYEVENGVLKSVKIKGTEQGDGTATDTPVAFEGNVELKQPKEGETYTSIAAGVFGGNQNITYVKLPAGVTSVAAESFKGCTNLKSVYLPSSVTSIEKSAFENCTSMTQVSVPKAVKSIGDDAFRGDVRLHLVYIKDVDYAELETIGAGAFAGCAVLSEFCTDTGFAIPNKVKSIGAEAFKGCKAIKNVDFKDTKLAEMGTSAFEGCTGLAEVNFGKNLALIPERAFADCTALASVNFVLVGSVNMTIGEFAFSGCYNLKQLVLPQSVNVIKNDAFQNCTKLTRVEIGCDSIALEASAFPVENPELVIVAKEGSTGDDYALKYGKRADKDKYYKYTVEDVDGSVIADGKFPGGTIWIGTADKSKFEENINTLNGKKGVKSDGTKYYVYQMPKEGYTFIEESLKCNGQPMQKEKNGKYSFTMPAGGAVITAEFRSNTPDKIKGQKVTVEFSAGVPLQNGKQDGYGYLGVELKVGQTTRLYVLDEDGASIPASKLKFSSTKKEVAVINSNGVITAAGTGSKESADAEITVEVTGGDGKPIVFKRTISVVTSEAKNIILKASDYRESQVEITTRESGIQTASIDKVFVKSNNLTFTLKANVYDGENAISKKLTWTSSDTRVAALGSDTTEAKDPVNKVTVKKGCEGEATITVTANNADGAEKKKITQKFVVRVYQEGYKLTSSSVTVNPNMMDGGDIELISTSGTGVGKATIQLYEEKSMSTTAFTVDADESTSREDSNCKKFHIKPVASSLANGTYKVRVGVNGGTNEQNFIPLTITVKRTTPSPTIKFNTKKTKFNLFYKDGGKTADGEQTVVTTEITKLGSAKIRDVVLEPTNPNKDDDKLFTENFEVDKEASNFATGKIIIRRKEGNIKYTSKKKAAVTGYLVVYYEGFADSAAKKMKVTMPTCTTAPSYALRETKAVYRTGCPAQDVELEVYDKNSKKKEQVILSADSDTVTETQKDIILNKDPEIRNGVIVVNFVPEKGKLKLVLSNKDWELKSNGKPRTVTFNFAVSTSDTKPTIKTNKSSVSLNVNYPEAEAEFTLTSNQKGIDLAGKQTFEPVITSKNADEIEKLEVAYINGQGSVAIKDRQEIKTGTYKFTCEPQSSDWADLKKVTLTVKVVNTKPVVKLGSGSLQLNLAAFRNNDSAVTDINDSTAGSGNYKETAEIPFKVSGLPDGYTLADVGTGSQNTKIECTKNPEIESHFVFRVTEGNPEEKIDNVLSVSLKDGSVAKGTYSFRMTAAYQKTGRTTLYAKPITVKVKVYSNGDIKLTVAAKGKINLLNREGKATDKNADKNGIIYTPTLKNVKGEITDVKIYDGGSLDKESAYFDIEMITEGKNKGKFFVTPKKTVKNGGTTTEPGNPETPGTPTEPNPENPKPTDPETPVTPPDPSNPGTTTDPTNPGGNDNTAGTDKPEATTPPDGSDKGDTSATVNMLSINTASLSEEQPVEYEYASLQRDKEYPVRIWVKVKGYAGKAIDKNGVLTKTISIKASQVLPKVTTDKTEMNVYLSTKDYNASFVVTPKKGSVGTIESVYFKENDEKANESFELIQEPQADGSMKVTVHLKEGLEYPKDSVNDVKMYVKFKGQGEKTPETATTFTMKIKVN